MTADRPLWSAPGRPSRSGQAGGDAPWKAAVTFLPDTAGKAKLQASIMAAVAGTVAESRQIGHYARTCYAWRTMDGTMPTDHTGTPKIDRRLAAVVAVDVVAYSNHMHLDEEWTHARYKADRSEVIDPCIAKYKGRIVKSTGDGFLAEFPSAVEAARCMIEVQTALAGRNLDQSPDQRMEFRIGINLGDVIIEQDDIYGDGVNIAARLEAIAEPGGICISSKVHDEIIGKIDFSCQDLGLQQLRNIGKPIRAYRLTLEASNESFEAGRRPRRSNLGEAREVGAPALSLTDKPSIAVLPFENLSPDSEQEYFADGIVEDIITALSRMRWLFVIARNSSFTYKNRHVDVRQVGRELGVRYVLEGSVRKAGNRVRISGQLMDVSTGAHLWADHFDGAFEDIFDLQDSVTARVVGAIAPKLEQAEIERARRKPTDNLDAYDYYLRGMASFHKWNRKGIAEALALFYQAIALDPEFAAAYGMAAWCFVPRRTNNWMDDRVRETTEAGRLARQAAKLGKDDAVALYTGGYALANVVGDLDTGAALIDRGLALNPNLAAAWHNSGWVRVYLGEPEIAIEHIKHAMRLSPLDSLLFGMQGAIAFAHYFAGRYDEASIWADMSVREEPLWFSGLVIVGASKALAGRLDEAQRAIERACHRDPTFRISEITARMPLRRRGDLARLEEGLRKAGLSEK